jgi:hypothetical protein
VGAEGQPLAADGDRTRRRARVVLRGVLEARGAPRHDHREALVPGGLRDAHVGHDRDAATGERDLEPRRVRLLADREAQRAVLEADVAARDALGLSEPARERDERLRLHDPARFVHEHPRTGEPDVVEIGVGQGEEVRRRSDAPVVPALLAQRVRREVAAMERGARPADRGRVQRAVRRAQIDGLGELALSTATGVVHSRALLVPRP